MSEEQNEKPSPDDLIQTPESQDIELYEEDLDRVYGGTKENKLT